MEPLLTEQCRRSNFTRKRAFDTAEPETSLQLGCPSTNGLGLGLVHNNANDFKDFLYFPDLLSSQALSFPPDNLLPLESYQGGGALTKSSSSFRDDASVLTEENHCRFEWYMHNGPPAMKRKSYLKGCEDPNKGKAEAEAEAEAEEEEQGLRLYHKKPQFRDHIWAYAQMFRAETCMKGDFQGELELHSNNKNKCEIEPKEGVELVQRLFACAEAVACRDARQASGIINDLAYLVSPYGTSLQRVATCFIQGLAVRLAVLLNPKLNNNSSSEHAAPLPMALALPLNNIKEPSDKDKEEALRLVYELCPYIPLGHFAANVAIMEAFEGEDYVHVVDLGMSSGLSRGLQWCDLIDRLVRRCGGAPRLLRITGIGSCGVTMAEIGAHIKAHAEAADVALEFQGVESALENVAAVALASMVDMRGGEALAVNSVVELHCVVKESRGSLNAVLQAIHKLRPRVLTLVEQDASHNGPFFLGRFMEALYYYSAIFDSLDTILPRPSTQRVKMEQYYFGEEIKNIVSCEGPARVERHERVDQWRRRMSRAGFQSVPLKIIAQAKAWLGHHYPCDGYTLTEEKGYLVLGWRGKPIIAASCWKC